MYTYIISLVQKEAHILHCALELRYFVQDGVVCFSALWGSV